MAKKDAIKRTEISYDGELRRWLEIRLDHEYRKFFDSYARRFLKRVTTLGKGEVWILSPKIAESARLYEEHNEAFKSCSQRWGLIRPLDFRDVKPKGRLLVSGPAHLAHPFLHIKDPVVFFRIDLNYSGREIIEAFSSELTKLRQAIAEQNKYGFKKVKSGKYSKIGIEGRRPNLEELIEWSEIYELKYLSGKVKTDAQVANELEDRYPEKSFDEKLVTRKLRSLSKHFKLLKKSGLT